MLLQVLDDGRLTDGKGRYDALVAAWLTRSVHNLRVRRTVDFRNAVIILTSNLGAQQLLQDVAKHGTVTPEGERAVMNQVRSRFAPEFLNRLDDIVVFSPLSSTALLRILNQLITIASNRPGLVDKNVTLSMEQSGADSLIAAGYDPSYGARPLRRLIDRIVLTDISKLLLAGEIADNGVVNIKGNVDGTLQYAVMAAGSGNVTHHRSRPIKIEEGSGNQRRRQSGGSTGDTTM
eukprot:SAG31_NODE_4147_length_3531_cov_1.458333_4_plen_234_part_00